MGSGNLSAAKRRRIPRAPVGYPLSEIAHEWLIAPEFGQLLEELHARQDLAGEQQRNVALSLEDYNKQKKFTPPHSFVA